MAKMSEYISSVLTDVADALNVEAAQRLLEMQPDDEVVRHAEHLAAKANEGELTDKERDEYLAFITASEMLAILQLKARRRIARPSAA